MEEKSKKKLKYIGISLGLTILIICSLYFAVEGTVENKTMSGELIGITRYPQSDGWDIVLFLNDSGVMKYLVINEWKTGIMVELEDHIGDNVEILYAFKPLFDINIITDYRVLE